MRKTLLYGGVAAAILGAVLATGVVNQSAAMGGQVSEGTPPIINWLIGGGGGAAILAWLSKFIGPWLMQLLQRLIPGMSQSTVGDALDVGQLGVYALLYRQSGDETERAKLRSAAHDSLEHLFNEWFPVTQPEQPK